MKGVNMNWKQLFDEEKTKPYFQFLSEFVQKEYATETIYPPEQDLFKAFLLTPLDKIKVVILGQDPYQTPGFANGLAFSVSPGISIPKSLQNIYKEQQSELGLPIPNTGDLTPWAKKGIFLLNRILTVRKGVSLSHAKAGWEIFTQRVIEEINKQDRPIVFLLLGAQARTIAPMLTNPKHLVLITSHPSPLGAYAGFFGSGIFQKTCDFLQVSKDFWRLDDAK
jgi:uracil-DNA glycosylase